MYNQSVDNQGVAAPGEIYRNFAAFMGWTLLTGLAVVLAWVG